MTRILTILLAFSLSAAALADENSTEFVAAGHLTTVSGDEGRANDHEGVRDGVLLVANHRSEGFDLGARFSPTTEGWLTLGWTPSPSWRLEFSLDRTRRYSDTSVRPPLTPLGTPVSVFYPGSNTLDGAFGEDEPVTTRTRWKARAAYLLDFGVIDFTLRGVELNGEKTPEAQGISFGDYGAPAFYSPGLRRADTSQMEGALGARFSFPFLSVAARFAMGTLDSRTETSLPVWGSSSLLEISQYTDSFDADTVNATLAAAHQSEGVQFALGGAYSEVESENGFSGGRLQQGSGCSACGGQTFVATDTLEAGRSDVKRMDGAGSFTAEVLPGLSLRLSGSIGREETEASGRQTTPVRSYDLAQSQDIERWRAWGELTWRYEGLRLSALGGREQRTNDASFLRGTSIDQSESKRVRDSLRGEARWKVGSFRIAVSGGHRAEDTTMTYKELVNGYQAGSSESTQDDFKAALSGKLGKAPFSLTGTYLSGTADLDPALFEPIYDPTWEFTVARAKTRASAVVFHISTPGGSAFEAWGEIGYRQQEWEFPETVTFPGFLNVDEEVKGMTAAAGMVWIPAETWKVDLSGWLDAPSETVDHRAYRLEVGVEKNLTKTLDALLRYHFRKFEEALYTLDDYTLSAFTLGVRGRF